VAAGADGLIVEVHHEPELAVCDGEQALTPGAFQQMMGEIERVVVAVGRSLAV
jgi:3-deoxy-7-phosphoheptulonate synthase